MDLTDSLEKLVDDLIKSRQEDHLMSDKLEDIAFVLYEGVNERSPTDKIYENIVKVGGWYNATAYEKVKVCEIISDYRNRRVGLEANCNKILDILKQAGNNPDTPISFL